MQQRFYSPELDGLRFIAALLVIIHHGPRLPFLGAIKDYGWIGVDLFLFLSAYLITRLAMIEHERTGTFDLRSFFIRRALRIWPLYLTFATAVCALSIFKVGPGAAFGWWLTHLSFTNNVATAIVGYSPVIWSGHLWTISLEEQAYLGLALFLAAYFASAKRRAAPIVLSALGVLIIARLALALLDAPHPFVWVLPLRADTFLLGCLAALMRLKNRLWYLPAGVVVMACIALFPPMGSNGAADVIGYTIIAAGCGLVTLGAQCLRPLGMLRYPGKISYGLYVYHLVGLYFGEILARDQPLLRMGIALAVTFATSAVSYRLLERPFLKLKSRFEIVPSRPA